MVKRLERWLPHATILICNMYIVFFLIDRVNTAMNFIDNGLTKGLLLLLCAAALFNARRSLIAVMARRERSATPVRDAGAQPLSAHRQSRQLPAAAAQPDTRAAHRTAAGGHTEPRKERRYL